MTLSKLNPGEKGVIDAITDIEMSPKLMEMGCIPGECVVVEKLAPLGDPMIISVAGYQLCLRMSEAEVIKIRS